MGGKVIPIPIGARFGQLEVIGEAGSNSRGLKLWCLRCACGKEKVLAGTVLRDGQYTSCGCVMRARILEGASFHGGDVTFDEIDDFLGGAD
jgi:hypothetical protein